MIRSRPIKLFFFCFILFALFTAFSPAAAALPEAEKSCLWEIKEGKHSVYLLGAIHLMKKDAYPLSTAIEKAYRDSEIIIFEADIDAMNDPAFQLKMMSFGMYQDGGTLNRNLPEKTYLLLKKKLAENGLSVTGFDLFKPWFCAMAISIAELKKLGFDPAFGIDTYFFNKAKQDDKKRSFFETREFQLNLFNTMEELNQTLFLEQTLKDIKVIETMFPEIIKCWKNENSEELGNIINRSFKDYPAVYERFIINRNNNWLPEIEDLIQQDKKVLIVVGVGHLVGEQGLIKMLKNKGCKIKQH